MNIQPLSGSELRSSWAMHRHDEALAVGRDGTDKLTADVACALGFPEDAVLGAEPLTERPVPQRAIGGLPLAAPAAGIETVISSQQGLNLLHSLSVTPKKAAHQGIEISK